MKPRERALATIRHEEVFPVLMDVFENGVYPELERRLRQHFRLPPARDLEPAARDDLLVALGACSRRANAVYVGPPLEEHPTMKAAWPIRKATRTIWGTCDGPESYTDLVKRPPARAETTSDIDAHRWPQADWFDFRKVGVPSVQREAAVDLVQWADENASFLRIVGGAIVAYERLLKGGAEYTEYTSQLEVLTASNSPGSTLGRPGEPAAGPLCAQDLTFRNEVCPGVQ